MTETTLTDAEAKTKLDDTETAAQTQQRHAVTIINMINNVFANSNAIHVQTTDPFVAGVARAYIDYLKKRGVAPASEAISQLADEPQQKEGGDIVNTLKNQLENSKAVLHLLEKHRPEQGASLSLS